MTRTADLAPGRHPPAAGTSGRSGPPPDGQRPPIHQPPLDGINLADSRRDEWPASGRALKRAIDVLGACIALVILSPMLILLAVAVRVDSRGPALFHQVRVGRDGNTFVLLKFRTMVANAERLRAELVAHSAHPAWLALDHDPRITRLGRFLRRTSLDELPQLWNVARGEMSLVGPRPLIPLEHEQVPSWGRAREAARPGMTGLWQVMGRTALPFEDMLVLDTLYVERWSLRADIDILLRTMPAVLTQRGAN